MSGDLIANLLSRCDELAEHQEEAREKELNVTASGFAGRRLGIKEAIEALALEISAACDAINDRGWDRMIALEMRMRVAVEHLNRRKTG